jgi:ClpP class serine protease
VKTLGIVLLLLLVLAVAMAIGQARLLEVRRRRGLEKLERLRGSRVLTLIHRQELRTIFGIPVARYIDIEDSEQILRAIRRTPSGVPIDLFLHTPGGLLLPTEQIAFALRNHPSRVTVIIPHYAMSGGTLIALAADEILMDENAALGPVEPQVGEYPAMSILRATSLKQPADLDDHTLILADIARLALEEVQELIRRLLPPDSPPEAAERLCAALTQGRWTHDYAITFAQARDLGLAVRTGVPDQVYGLMDLYQQARAE